MCSVNQTMARCYPLRMQPEQKIIAEWLERVRAKKGWSWQRWAEEAGIGAATTLTRAIKDDYNSVTSVETLNKLARAANVPSILDFLDGTAVNVEAVRAVLSELLPLAPRRRWAGEDVEHFVEALLYALELPPTGSASETSRDAYGVAAHAAIQRLRDLRDQS